MNRNGKHIVTLMLGIWLLLPAAAQKLRFERFTVESGLQNNIVFALTEDAKGFMWFATSTGIDRFDGYQFSHYPLPQKNNSYNSYAQVQYILADGQKNIWAASATLVYRYNPKKDVFELPADINNWFEKNKTITWLSVSGNGENLLLGANNGIMIYHIGEKKITASTQFNQYTRCVYQDARGIVWAGVNKGLYRFVLNGNTANPFNDDIPALAPLKECSITGISQDARGRYWFATPDKGLYVYDEQAKTLVMAPLPKPAARYYAIKDVYHQKGETPVSYITTDGGGLVLLNENLQVQQVYQTNEDDPTSLSNNAAYDIFADSYNRTWITTYGGGVNLLMPTVQPFVNFLHEINNNNSLSNNAAKAITEDAAGNLWFGTRKGISILNRSTQQWRHFNEEIKTPGLTSDNILALAADAANIWAGTYGGGLLQGTAGSGQFKSYLNNPKDSGTIGTDYVYAVLADSKGRIWAGGIRGPLSYLDRATGRFIKITTPVSSVNCLLEDSRGRILAGTEKGVYVVEENKLQPLLKGMANERVLAMLEHSPGKLWLATFGGGVVVAGIEKGVERTLKTADGLPSDVVCALQKDRIGDVWIGTSKGIAHYQAAGGNITVYTKADGLAGSQVNYGAAYYTRNGEMVFGTTDGFSLFHPEHIKTKGYKPVIVFTGLTVNNQLVRAGEKESPLSVQLDETEKLLLKYYQNSFSIGFVNTTPAFSGKHLYSWKLEGFDKEWSQPSVVPTAVYTNLNSGRYTLLVKSFAKGQSQNVEIKRLQIVVKAPWWKTTWAYIGYLLLLAAGVFSVYNYTRNSNARKKYAERLKLNTSISHEIRTPLTLIKGPVSALTETGNLSEENRNNLLLAKKNIEKLEAIIAQFIDYQKTGFNKQQMQVVRGDIVHLLDEVGASFVPLMKEKNIHFTYKKPSEKTELLYDRDKMEKVFNNLLSNAVKYTPAGKDIGLEVTKEPKYLVIQVSDTGIGIPPNQQQFIFKGYFRANNTMNIKETGSGVGLSVARELVEMHHGKLSFTSTPEKGTVFTVRLPLQNSALLTYLVSEEEQLPGGQLPEIQKSSPATLSGKKILVAEDNDELRSYLQKESAAHGLHVLVAADGKEALELARKQMPDLLITDVMMPEMNGFQLCDQLKKDIATCHIPVIMLTAIHDRDYLLEGYRSGADDYVRKPFDPAYMLARIENLLLNRTRFRNKIMSVFEQEDTVVANDAEITWLKKVTELIMEHLGDADFSVEKLSRLLATSRPVLFRKFKAVSGEAPQQYIQKIRLRKSVELLKQGQLNINEIAYECGFNDPKYFSTVFKAQFGKTPSEYARDKCGK